MKGGGRSATFYLFFPFIDDNNFKNNGHNKSKGAAPAVAAAALRR